jgi:NAD(P)-dependent dehydrogenase (short-subunit alcohol dehydrogenase family)
METSSMHGKVAIVTGAGGGIGAATAGRLSAAGAHVVLVDIDGKAVAQVAAGLPAPCLAVEADVASERGVERYMAAACKHFGRVDLHHLNAGVIGSFTPFPDLDVADFDNVVGINLRGPFLGMRSAFRQYALQASQGAVVITASIASLRGSHDLVAYQASKHGVLGILRCAAMYGGPLGIRVNAVAPGLVPTALFSAQKDVRGGGNDMARRGTTVPLRRTGTPDEIAAVVVFLLSDDASYVHGEVISVDGGSAIVSTVRPSGGAGAWDTALVDRRPELDAWRSNHAKEAENG